MRRWILAGSLLVVTWLSLYPATIDPVEYASAGESGTDWAGTVVEFTAISTFADLAGAEDVEIDSAGPLWTGLSDGSLVRLDPRSRIVSLEKAAATGGRPLGLDLDATGILWVADAELGLVAVERAGGSTVRCDLADGVPVHFANDVAVAPDGRVYFSDASTRFGPEELALEALEARPHGRLIRFDPATTMAQVLLDDLHFANGVAVAADGAFVLVAETFRYRVRRYWLTGPGAGRDEILLDNLPGFPDGISTTERGTFWVALYRPRSRMLDEVLHPRPWLKRQIAKLPGSLLVNRSRMGRVLEIDVDGNVLRSLHDPGGERFFAVTSVEEHDGKLYLASIEAAGITVVSLAP